MLEKSEMFRRRRRSLESFRDSYAYLKTSLNAVLRCGEIAPEFSPVPWNILWKRSIGNVMRNNLNIFKRK